MGVEDRPLAGADLIGRESLRAARVRAHDDVVGKSVRQGYRLVLVVVSHVEGSEAARGTEASQKAMRMPPPTRKPPASSSMAFPSGGVTLTLAWL